MAADDDMKKKSAKKESTTVVDNSDPGVQKTITTTTTTVVEEEDQEPEKLDFDFDPNKQLTQALEEQRQAERDCIQQLVDENVRLEREKKMALEDAQEYRAKLAALQIELDAERGKHVSMRESMVIQSQKEEAEKNNNNNNSEEYEVKIRDLQMRLKRLADDDKEKDLNIEKLEKDKAKGETYVAVLEGHLGEIRVDEIKKEMEERKTLDEVAPIGVDRSQLVRQGQVNNSKICIVM